APERFSPDLPGSSRLRAEHEARYAFAASLAEGAEVLDVGAGAGGAAAACLARGAKRVVTLDSSEDACGELRRLFSGKTNVEILRAPAEELPWKSPVFDLALLFEAIEHVADPGKVLSNIRQVLRPEGLLLLSAPAREYPPNPHHRQVFTRTSLEGLLRAHFPHVRFFRQQNFWGTAVLPESHPEASLPFAEGPADYWLAVASSRKIERRFHPVLSAAPLETYENGTLGRLAADLRHVQAERDGLLSDLAAVRKSLRWRATDRILSWLGLDGKK
ncbi:MAG: class I SAM-dependent methyltransferase, partial [Bdellovibrionota bacterium]